MPDLRKRLKLYFGLRHSAVNKVFPSCLATNAGAAVLEGARMPALLAASPSYTGCKEEKLALQLHSSWLRC